MAGEPGLIVPVRSVNEYGAVPSVLVDQASAIQLAIDSVPSGTTLRVPAGDYRVDTTVVVNRAIRLEGPGRLVAAHDSPCISVEADDVYLGGGLSLKGRQRTKWIPGARGISCIGTIESPRRRLHISDVNVTQFGGGGIVLEFVQDFTSTDTVVEGCAYYGMALVSVQRAAIIKPTVVDISTGGLPNAYGITATRWNGPLAVHPRSSDVLISDALIDGVPDWAGIDTHGGRRITALRCIVLRCKRGIDFVGGTNELSVVSFAPLDVAIQDCVVDGTGIKTSHGIGVSGAGTVVGSPIEYATGMISGNHVIRSGDASNHSLGGFWFRTTLGLRAICNRATEPGSHGVVLSSDNQAFIISGLQVTDPWSDTHTIPSVVSTRSTNNSGVISGFYGRRGGKEATSVLAYGFYQSDPSTTTTVAVGPDCAVESGTLLAEGGGGLRTGTSMNASVVRVGRGNGRVGFFSATPIPKPVIRAAASDGATTQALVNDLRTALISLGLLR
ncbi:glycoside hydrolase family 55 protein [Cryobacterium sp. Sr3]|uniref:glycoside hydrolase family 55 protein n=1 Tax=Cryobacterium sp. Sr3 TaxID=1259194 RepID=UPI001F53E551|nr:glycoside hydrolase family 55 protein [Cryobacterium sp. Sr3]